MQMPNSKRFAISNALKDRTTSGKRAKRKTTPKKPSTKQVTVRLNPNELSMLKVLSAKEAVTPAHFLRQSIIRTCLRDYDQDEELMTLMTTGGAL